MQIRVVRLHGRNRLVGAALLLAMVGLVLVVVLFGLTLLVGLAAIGAVGLLARRLLGGRRRAGAPPPVPLDPSREVLPRTPHRPHGALPPGGG